MSDLKRYNVRIELKNGSVYNETIKGTENEVASVFIIVDDVFKANGAKVLLRYADKLYNEGAL